MKALTQKWYSTLRSTPKLFKLIHSPQWSVVGRSALGLVEVTCVSDVSYSMLDLSTSRDNLGLVNDGDNFGAVNGRDNLGVVNGAAIRRASN